MRGAASGHWSAVTGRRSNRHQVVLDRCGTHQRAGLPQVGAGRAGECLDLVRGECLGLGSRGRVGLEVPPGEFLDPRRKRVAEPTARYQERAEPRRGVDLPARARIHGNRDPRAGLLGRRRSMVATPAEAVPGRTPGRAGDLVARHRAGRARTVLRGYRRRALPGAHTCWIAAKDGALDDCTYTCAGHVELVAEPGYVVTAVEQGQTEPRFRGFDDGPEEKLRGTQPPRATADNLRMTITPDHGPTGAGSGQRARARSPASSVRARPPGLAGHPGRSARPRPGRSPRPAHASRAARSRSRRRRGGRRCSGVRPRYLQRSEAGVERNRLEVPACRPAPCRGAPELGWRRSAEIPCRSWRDAVGAGGRPMLARKRWKPEHGDVRAPAPQRERMNAAQSGT